MYAPSKRAPDALLHLLLIQHVPDMMHRNLLLVTLHRSDAALSPSIQPAGDTLWGVSTQYTST